MVSAVLENRNELVRWGGFLALSFAVNYYLLASMSINTPVVSIPPIEKIRISLSAIAAPKPAAVTAPTPPEIAKTVPQQVFMPVPPAPKNIVKVKTASKKIAPSVAPVKPTPDEKVVKSIAKLEPVQPEQIPPAPRTRPKQFNKAVKNEPVKPVAKAPPAPKAVLKTEITDSKPKVAETADNQPDKTEVKAVAHNQGKNLSTVIHNANYRHRTPPTYPRRAYQLGQQGTVLLHALVDNNGRPGDLKVEKSSGFRMLDKAALIAVASWEFEPREEGGRKVKSWVRVPVKFIIR